jgi:hypothetical protein
MENRELLKQQGDLLEKIDKLAEDLARERLLNQRPYNALFLLGTLLIISIVINVILYRQC